jgi:hypothetical protein
LDDEKVIVRPTCPTREAVVLQPNAGVSFAIILDNVVRHMEAPWELCVLHGASECLWPYSFRVEAASLTVIMAPVVWVPHVTLGIARLHPLVRSNGTPGVLTMRPVGSTDREPISTPVRKSFLPQGTPRWPFALRP